MEFKTMKPFYNWVDMLDEGFVQSITRKMPSGYWDECGYYHVVFWDGTTRDFDDSYDILRFANCLLRFYRDKN